MFYKFSHIISSLTKYAFGLFCFIGSLLSTGHCFSQTDSSLILTFDFNDHTFNEKNNLTQSRAAGVSLVEDRFSNEASAVLLNGHINSYLSLGTSSLLKPKTGSISIWFNMARRIYTGKGDDFNPLFILKNGPQDDFNNAYCLAYSPTNKLFVAVSSKDSLLEAQICGVNRVEFGKWYHLVITSNATSFAFYVNGKLQGNSKKILKPGF